MEPAVTRDPVWKRAQELVDRLPMVRTGFFLGRLAHTLAFVRDLHGHAQPADAELARRVQQQILTSIGLAGLFDLLDRQAGSVLSAEQIRAAHQEVVDSLTRVGKERVRTYDRWILHQGLTKMCALLDGFLEEVLAACFARPGTPARAVADAGLRVGLRSDELLRFDSIEDLAVQIRRRELRRFSALTIRERLECLEGLLDFRVPDLLDEQFDTPDAEEELTAPTLDTLEKIYRNCEELKRDGVGYPLETVEQLAHIVEFFGRIIVRLSRIARQAGGIALDLERPTLCMLAYTNLTKATSD